MRERRVWQPHRGDLPVRILRSYGTDTYIPLEQQDGMPAVAPGPIAPGAAQHPPGLECHVGEAGTFGRTAAPLATGNRHDF